MLVIAFGPFGVLATLVTLTLTLLLTLNLALALTLILTLTLTWHPCRGHKGFQKSVLHLQLGLGYN